jgi:ABC-type multidrug transport system fused ATPase/permease subunit
VLVASLEQRPYLGTRRIDFSGRISLEGVTFAYSAEPVVEDIDLELEPGTIVGLAGPNGAGKSTIVNLIVGFYPPGSGSITADGVPYPDVDIIDLRRQMGIVPQLPGLVNDSVIGNIVYGRDGFDQAEVWRALDVACGDEFVKELPDGLDTLIGEEGVLLSGGQRQRLAIARAVLHRPRLLILDEPTNHLDRQTIGRVFDNISRSRPRPSILVISHNTEILHGVDRLIHIKDGRLAGC